MQIHINLSESEIKALSRLALAAGKDVESYLHDLVQRELQHGVVGDSVLGDTDLWQRQLQECIALHPSAGHVDDSRESIYGDFQR